MSFLNSLRAWGSEREIERERERERVQGPINGGGGVKSWWRVGRRIWGQVQVVTVWRGKEGGSEHYFRGAKTLPWATKSLQSTNYLGQKKGRSYSAGRAQN